MQSAGFTLIADSGGSRFQTHALHAQLGRDILGFSECDRYSLILIGRLHYRGGLLSTLRGSVDELAFQNSIQGDAALAHAVLKVLGTEGLCRLEGDFSLACYDRSASRILALRDPFGAYPVFWVQNGGRIGLSTTIRCLLELLPSVDFDTEYMADYLAFPTDAFSELPVQRTAFRGVQRLLPGSLLETDLSTGHVVCRPYWAWDQRVTQVAVRSVAEAGELVREYLETAVRERLTRQALTACHFSGGFDSTGVAMLADKMSANVGKSIHALSLTYPSDRVLAGEDEYVQCALNQARSIVHYAVPADDLTDFSDWERAPQPDEPSPLLAARFGLFAALTEIVSSTGIDTILTGVGGDHLFATPSQSFITDYLRTFRFGEALKLTRQYSHFSSQSPWRIAVRAMSPLLPNSVRDGVRPFLNGGRTDFQRLSERTVPPWFTDDFVRRYGLRHRILAWQSPYSRTGVVGASEIAIAAGGWYHWYVAMPRGMTVSNPFWDPRLVKVVLGLPKRLHLRAGPMNLRAGPMKPVLAAALRDVLPDKIIFRRGKENLNMLNAGLARNRSALDKIIQEAPIPDGVIDRSVLADSLDKASMGMYRAEISVGRLDLALSYLIWMSGHAKWINRPKPTVVLDVFRARSSRSLIMNVDCVK